MYLFFPIGTSHMPNLLIFIHMILLFVDLKKVINQNVVRKLSIFVLIKKKLSCFYYKVKNEEFYRHVFWQSLNDVMACFDRVCGLE